MAAEIKFYAGGVSYGTEITGSGLGFFGASFGTSVQVGEYQDSTYITDGTGTSEGPVSTNTKYPGNASGVEIDGGAEIQLNTVGTESGSVNVRFTFDTAVKTQNGELRIFDRVSADNDASGVTTQVAQLAINGSGVDGAGELQAAHNGWQALNGSGTVMTLLAGPGSGGLHPSGSATEDTRHDWFACLSASPDSIGSKTDYGLFVQLEYL